MSDDAFDWESEAIATDRERPVVPINMLSKFTEDYYRPMHEMFNIQIEKNLSNKIKFMYPFIKNGDPVPNYISEIDMDKYEIVLRKNIDKSL